MIKYNVNDINDYSYNKYEETETMCSHEFYITDREVYNFSIGRVYYGMIDRRFTAFKVLSIDFLAKYDGFEIKYNIELPDNKKITTFLSKGFMFYDKQSAINYIRYNNVEGVFNRISLNSFFSEELPCDAFAIKFARYGNPKSQYLIIPNLYYYDDKMETTKYTKTRFYFIRKDKDGIHYAAVDKAQFGDDRKPEQLYTSYEECDRQRRMLYDFDGEEVINDIELKENELYCLTTKDGESMIFLKDADMETKTSCKCYILDPDIYEDEDEVRGVCMSDGTHICNNDEIYYLDVAGTRARESFKNLLSKEIEKKEEDAALNAEYIEHLKKFL